jgi:hypothetical protein
MGCIFSKIPTEPIELEDYQPIQNDLASFYQHMNNLMFANQHNNDIESEEESVFEEEVPAEQFVAIIEANLPNVPQQNNNPYNPFLNPFCHQNRSDGA